MEMSVSSSPIGSKATLTTLATVGSAQFELLHVKRSRCGDRSSGTARRSIRGCPNRRRRSARPPDPGIDDNVDDADRARTHPLLQRLRIKPLVEHHLRRGGHDALYAEIRRLGHRARPFRRSRADSASARSTRSRSAHRSTAGPSSIRPAATKASARGLAPRGAQAGRLQHADVA